MTPMTQESAEEVIAPTLVERMAIAMREAERAENAKMGGWERASDRTKARFRHKARIALEAIRTPTTKMCLRAVEDQDVWGIGSVECLQIWQSMIQEALIR